MANPIEEKSFEFAVMIVKLNKYLNEVKKEYVFAKQLLRSGTSIGANVAEAQYAQSEADFISKNNIALKEAAETHFWLRLLEKSGILLEDEAQPFVAKCIEIKVILNAIVRSSKSKKKQGENSIKKSGRV